MVVACTGSVVEVQTPVVVVVLPGISAFSSVVGANEVVVVLSAASVLVVVSGNVVSITVVSSGKGIDEVVDAHSVEVVSIPPSVVKMVVSPPPAVVVVDAVVVVAAAVVGVGSQGSKPA